MKNLAPEVRGRAIEIANALLEERDYDRGKAIPIAIAKAEEWAEKRDKPIEAIFTAVWQAISKNLNNGKESQDAGVVSI